MYRRAELNLGSTKIFLNFWNLEETKKLLCNRKFSQSTKQNIIESMLKEDRLTIFFVSMARFHKAGHTA